MSDQRQASRGRGRVALAGAFALLALLASAPPAQATYNPLASGTTKLTLAKPFLALLKENKVKLTAIEGATLKHGVASFPVSGGKFDPTTANGFIEHAGALFFKAGKRSVPLTSLQLKTTQKHAPFSAKFGGGQLKLASTAKLTVSREGFASKVAVSTLKLSSKVAGRLNKKLRLRGVFAAGQPIATSITKANPQTVAVQQSGKASFTLDPGAAAKLQSLFVAVNPIFPAEHPGPFTFPIFAGAISTDASSGQLEAQGALELIQQGGAQLFWREFILDLSAHTLSAEAEIQPSPPYPGKQGRLGLGELSLSGASVTANPGALTISVANATVSLDAQTAVTLNEVFAKPLGKPDAFKAGDVLGSVSFAAVGE
jgi:hypothetical protein